MTGPGMRAGVVLPGGTANQQLEQAVAAEQAGWDGVFVWEAGYGVDAWTLLAAMAARTSRVRGWPGRGRHARRGRATCRGCPRTSSAAARDE